MGLLYDYHVTLTLHFVKVIRETVEKPLVRKMFIKISHNRLKNRQNVAQNTKN